MDYKKKEDSELSMPKGKYMKHEEAEFTKGKKKLTSKRSLSSRRK
jgi:hypothetical protein